MIYIASDHAGVEAKQDIINYLERKKLQYVDCGPQAVIEDDDYPDYAQKVAAALQTDHDKGILICGSGQGMAIVANKFAGIRAAQAWSVETAKFARHDDDANILCIASRAQTIDLPVAIAGAFLETKFDAIETRQRRLQKIHDLERKL